MDKQPWKILVCLSVLGIMLSSFSIEEKITVYLIGDSTMSIKEESAYPETGWGMPFKYFFDSTVVVSNHARNGRSTRTFISEGRWAAVTSALKKGDYVFIQFGHNDESEPKTDRYTPPDQYKLNLKKFISETRAAGATPVLLTPVSRRKFSNGQAVETHELYSCLVREVAKDEKVTFIDLDVKSRALYQEFGEQNSALLFLQLKPGEHPNYPDGKNDNTHFSELGARLIAQIILNEIKQSDLPLKERIVKPVRK